MRKASSSLSACSGILTLSGGTILDTKISRYAIILTNNSLDRILKLGGKRRQGVGGWERALRDNSDPGCGGGLRGCFQDPPDPGSSPSLTMGGNTLTLGGMVSGPKHGTTKNMSVA